MADTIRCRSRKSNDCYNGKPVEQIYGEDGAMADDGTWDGETVVCDSCYVAIGQPAVPVDHPGAETFGSQIQQPNPPTWYLSFVDEDKPEGERWLGGCYVRGSTLVEAVQEAHRQGCNPGGQVAAQEVPDNVEVPDKKRNVLLDRERVEL